MNNTRHESCEICGSQLSTFDSCVMCGARVCSKCFNNKEKLCLNCMEARCQICGEYLASRACNICGTLVCEDHGTKVGESTVCENCGMRGI